MEGCEGACRGVWGGGDDVHGVLCVARGIMGAGLEKACK